eukprot:m.113150 g.113150  ORF g.113150 m.113150 type:complete len:110 (+) comp12798_c0_seq1:158-487(+)
MPLLGLFLQLQCLLVLVSYMVNSIKNEVEEVAEGLYPKDNNVIVNAPHTALVSLSEEWPYPYSREKAAFPAPWMRHHSKVWPGCGRVDDVYGDRNIVCSCPPMDSYEDL